MTDPNPITIITEPGTLPLYDKRICIASRIMFSAIRHADGATLRKA
jgi:hypothetical protein